MNEEELFEAAAENEAIHHTCNGMQKAAGRLTSCLLQASTKAFFYHLGMRDSAKFFELICIQPFVGYDDDENLSQNCIDSLLKDPDKTTVKGVIISILNLFLYECASPCRHCKKGTCPLENPRVQAAVTGCILAIIQTHICVHLNSKNTFLNYNLIVKETYLFMTEYKRKGVVL